MAVTNFSLSASNSGGPIDFVVINDPSSGQHQIYPNRDPVMLYSKQQRLTIVALYTTMSGYNDLNHLQVTIDTYDSHGGLIGHSSFIAGNDPYIDVSSVPNATRYVTFSIYHPPIAYTHYQLYCSDDVSSFGVTAGNSEYTCTADDSPLVFNYEGSVTIHSVRGPSGESCAANKVDISSDGSTWLLSTSAAIPENRGGTKSAFIRYFGIPYTAYFRSMLNSFSYGVYVNGALRATISTAGSVPVTIYSNEEVILSGFSHPTGYGRPWRIYADSVSSWQDSSAEESSGSYKLWFHSRTRRVQVSATSKDSFFFNWWSKVYDPIKIKRKKNFSLNMMAVVWNRFCQRCYDTYRLWGTYPSSSLPTASSGVDLTADIFNAAIALVSGLPGAAGAPAQVSSGEIVKADYFHQLKAALNAAIEYYMDSD